MDDTLKVTPTADGKQPDPTTNQTVQDTVPSQEELEWSKLRGNAQQRFVHVLKERDELRKRIDEIQSNQIQYVPPVPPIQPKAVDPDIVTDEQKLAVQRMKEKYGFATQEDIEAERQGLLGQLQKMQDNILLDTEYNRLETMYDGRDGRPAFDRTEIEDHMRKTGIYNPEKAFDDLYKDELFDWKMSRHGKTDPTERKQSFSERPSAMTATKSEPLTKESLKERLSKSDGREWWEANRERLLPQLKDLV